jgi:serine/threonine protein phosphatase PrpC
MTADDTVAAEAARAGLIPLDEAETAYGAHMITRWLGPESGDPAPHIASTALTGPGRVVVCTDGLWNYASTTSTLAGHVAALPADAPAIEVARHLAAVALKAGGHDNITVIVMDIPDIPGSA